MAALCQHVCDDHRRLRGAKVGRRAQCTSLKANMGHLEACAAAAGLASLVVTPLLARVVPGNAQLRWSVYRRLLASYPPYRKEVIPGVG